MSDNPNKEQTTAEELYGYVNELASRALGAKHQPPPPDPHIAALSRAETENRIGDAGRNTNMGTALAPGSRFGPFKKLLLRLGRIFTSEQKEFNVASADALKLIYAQLEDLRRHIDERMARGAEDLARIQLQLAQLETELKHKLARP